MRISMKAAIENNLAYSNPPSSEPDNSAIKKMWSIGGGKGGVGKTLVTLSLGICLSKMDKSVVIVDADLGGANLHTFLGLGYPPYSLNDFLKKRINNINEACIETSIPNLKLICGGDSILSLSNPKFSQKARIIRNLNKLEADHILLDLGGGSSFNVLDFFNYTQERVVVVSPLSPSIQNAYGFLKSALYRRLTRLFSKNEQVLGIINKALDPGTEERISSIYELVETIDKFDHESSSIISQERKNFRTKLIVNMVKSKEDIKVGNLIKMVSDKYLGINVNVLSHIPYEERVEKSIMCADPFLLNKNGNKFSASIREIALSMID